MSSHYVVRRLFQALVALAGILVVTFLLVQLAPGDAVDTFGEGGPDEQAGLRTELGLDRPLPVQFLAYAGRVLTGDLGASFVQNGRPVTDIVGEYLPPTLLLMGTAVVLSSATGVALAVRAAKRPHGPFDVGTSLAALVAYAIPGFWLGQMAILVLGFHLGLFPLGGMTDPRVTYSGAEHLADVVTHLALPVLVLAAAEVAMVFRVTRTGILQEHHKDYVRTALAKGVSTDRVLSHHALRNALLPLVTVLGARVGFLFSGAVLVERLFAWPGMGTLLISSTEQRDLPVVLGTVLIVSGGIIGANLLTDLIYARIDPRIRYD